MGLLILPELFSTGTVVDLSEFYQKGGAEIYRQDKEFLSRLAQRTGCFVLGSSIVNKKNKLENISLIFNPTGRSKGIYKKSTHFQLGEKAKIFDQGKKF